MKLEWKICVRLGVTVFVTFLAIHYWSKFAGLAQAVWGAASALIIGCIVAYVLNILMSFYERHYFTKIQNPSMTKSRRAICLLGAILTLVAVIALVIGLVLPEVANCVRLLASEIPLALDALVEWLEGTGILGKVMTEDAVNALTTIDWQEKIAEMLSVLAAGVGGSARRSLYFGNESFKSAICNDDWNIDWLYSTDSGGWSLYWGRSRRFYDFDSFTDQGTCVSGVCGDSPTVGRKPHLPESGWKLYRTSWYLGIGSGDDWRRYHGDSGNADRSADNGSGLSDD